MSVARRGLQNLVPAVNRDRVHRRRRGLGAYDDHVGKCRALGQFGRQGAQSLFGSDQDAHTAVAQDVSNLLGLEQRVDRDEHRAVRRGTKGGDHCFGALVEVDRDPLGAADAQCGERRREAADVVRQTRVLDDIRVFRPYAVERGENNFLNVREPVIYNVGIGYPF